MISKQLYIKQSFLWGLLAFVLFSFIMLPVKNGYILRWYDEMSLFMGGDVFLNRMLHYPGGLLQYAGTWLTQFMYYPWVGSAILIVLWALLTTLCHLTWKTRDGLQGLSLLPAMFLLVSVLVLDEAWVSLNYPGYLFAPTLGAICSVITVSVARLIDNRLWHGVFLAASMALFVMLGYFALLGVAVGAADMLISLGGSDRKRKCATSGGIIIAAAAATLVPLLYYNLYTGLTSDSKLLYLQGLPDLLPARTDLYLWLPLAGMSLSLIAMPLLTLFKEKESKKRTDNSIWLTCVLLIATGCYGVTAGKKSEQFRATVLMTQHIDSMRWDKIAYIMSQIKEPPNFTMKVIGNLAAIKLGGGAETVKYTPKADEKSQRHSEEFLMTAFVKVPVYYHLGNTHGSYRWAMEHTVKYGTRAYFLKYMVRSSIKHGEFELASRYNRLLMNTMFHRRWAEHFQRYIDNPELIKESPEFNSIPENPEGNRFV